MEADEMEMTKAELQSLIRDRVQKTLLTSSALNEKFYQLRSLLSRNERQISKLSSVCQSVAKCEQTVKELYSMLGWEYEDHSDESDAEPSGCSRARPFHFATSRRHIHKTPPFQTSSSQSSSSEDEGMEERHEERKSSVRLTKKAVVVLTKLKHSEVTAALRTPSPQPDSSSEDAVFNGSESDMQWEPETDSNDSEFNGSDSEIKPHKRRKIDTSYRRCTRTKKTRVSRRFYRIVDSSASSDGSTSSNENNGAEMSPGEAISDDDNTLEAMVLQENGSKTIMQSEERKTMESVNNKTTELSKSKRLESGKCNTSKSGKLESAKTKSTESEERKTMELRKRKPTNSDKGPSTESDNQKTTKAIRSKTTPEVKTTTTTTTTSQSNTKTNPQRNTNKTSTPSADIKGGTPVNSLVQNTTSTPPKVLQVEITVNMKVLARRRTLSWKPGRITEIITKGDGKVKYKVVFEEEGKCLVSSHHIALVTLPQLDYLFVGARVVVKSTSEQADFKPGILVEVPSRKNRMRFLVFIDDHTPVYCSLPSLHLVCKPLADPLDDIPDENHRSYMRQYLNVWPYPPLTQYKVGQMVNVQYNGVLEKCEVLEIDCSLIQVIFKCDQQKEWIFRGSMRLEHIVGLRKDMETKTNGEKK